jgi:anti-sigma factor RsiW
MSKQIEISIGTHPTTLDLDRLRVGLLDETPTVSSALRAHLDRCPECQEQTALWPRITAALAGGVAERGLAGRIGARRQRALQGVPAQTPPRARLILVMAATLTAVAIGLGVFILPERDDTGTSVVAEAQSADFYVDIDFYLWLMEKQGNDDASPSG